MKHAVINESGIVVNTILWDGKSIWSPPKNHYVVKSDTACIGDIYNKEKELFIKPDII